MNKAELIKSISETSGLSQKDTALFMDCFTDVVVEAVASGENVKIMDFGTFSSKVRAPKLGVNPQKPEEKVQIPSKTVPIFRAGKEFKNKVKK